MTIDLTGGIDPAREYVFAERPENPEMRDSVSFWIIDDRGEIGLPRIGIEAVAANWDNHDIQVNVAFPDGRVYRLRGSGPSLPATGPDGKPSVLGAGGLAFDCIEPFDTWTMTYDGPAVQTSSADLVAGKKDGPLVDVTFTVEATMAVPPWVQGALQRDAAERLTTSIEGDLMGGPRYEQLFRATGSLTIAVTTTSVSPAAACGSAAKVSASSPASGATPGSRRCSPAAKRSATSPIRRDPTASPPSTKATSSPATAHSSQPASSRRRGSPGCRRWARTCRWCSRPPTARSYRG